MQLIRAFKYRKKFFFWTAETIIVQVRLICSVARGEQEKDWSDLIGNQRSTLTAHWAVFGGIKVVWMVIICLKKKISANWNHDNLKH